MSTQLRQPAGAPSGGQFAASSRPETGTVLTVGQLEERLGPRPVRTASADGPEEDQGVRFADHLRAIAARTGMSTPPVDPGPQMGEDADYTLLDRSLLRATEQMASRDAQMTGHPQTVDYPDPYAGWLRTTAFPDGRLSYTRTPAPYTGQVDRFVQAVPADQVVAAAGRVLLNPDRDPRIMAVDAARAVAPQHRAHTTALVRQLLAQHRGGVHSAMRELTSRVPDGTPGKREAQALWHGRPWERSAARAYLEASTGPAA